jgi:hypothetical protein
MADQNQDQIVQMCRQAVADIIAQAGGVGNLLQDEGRMALIQAIGQRLAQLGADITGVMGAILGQAYYDGMQTAESFLQTDAEGTTIGGINKQVHLAGVASITADAMIDMNASFRTAMTLAIENIDQILQAVKTDIAKGMIKGDGSKVVAQSVQATFAKNGMSAFITKDGKKLPLDFYASTVTRTKTRVAHNTGAIERYKESGVYHVKIDEHHPTCSKCARYQGLVVALDKNNAKGFPVGTIDPDDISADVPLPPYHPNCQHVIRPFVMEGHSKADITTEKKKWQAFHPDNDPRTEAQKNLYKAEQDIRKKARQELKEYTMMKSMMGDEAPKTIGAYRRLKRKNDPAWQALQQKYKDNLATAIDPGKGTPKRKKGSAMGTGGAVNTKTATPPKKATQPKQKAQATASKTTPVKTAPVQPTEQVDKPDMSTMSTPNVKARTMPQQKAVDQKAIEKFDKFIDGIEFANRRDTAQFLLDQIPGSAKLKVAKITANGHCGQITLQGGRIKIGEFALRRNDVRPMEYKHKTMFHEFFHANMETLVYPEKGFDKTWTRWEETATECSAFFMTKRAGIDISNIVPSYPDHLVQTLPILKQTPEFADCETLEDFGAVFMKYRFGSEKTADWQPFLQKVAQSKPKTIKHQGDLDEYFLLNYKDKVMDNLDRYTDMLFDTIQQPEKQFKEKQFKEMLRTGLITGTQQGRVNREIQMLMPVLFNEHGVKGL